MRNVDWLRPRLFLLSLALLIPLATLGLPHPSVAEDNWQLYELFQEGKQRVDAKDFSKAV
ncbi:hypothetical protein GS597_02060 [Synechococcales cyanobacterium C]|uniref:Uncharacterized protein n=1 Tax=Petrachloros mirabilis ULC683 TaxID=2781853 RepID=A0A8K1ZX71_9CYAN|nr:hypothetical protein [Petrachloros mirabilis]NCJ05317.1 hypothetical protein [Petrachloros mirabilis ULC683]